MQAGRTSVNANVRAERCSLVSCLDAIERTRHLLFLILLFILLIVRRSNKTYVYIRTCICTYAIYICTYILHSYINTYIYRSACVLVCKGLRARVNRIRRSNASIEHARIAKLSDGRRVHLPGDNRFHSISDYLTGSPALPASR